MHAAAGTSSAIERLIADIPRKGDYPAAARVVRALRDAVRAEHARALAVARIILEDPGLSAKVLRVVNSAFYRHGDVPISTVTRAVFVLGFEKIRDLATGLVLLEEVARRGHRSPQLVATLRRSLHAGLLAQALAAKVGYPMPEEAYLLGLFANWGSLWLTAHYPEECARAAEIAAAEDIPFERAVARVLGVLPSELAVAILEHWHFPARYAEYFRHPSTDRLPAGASDERLFAIVSVADEWAATATDGEPSSDSSAVRRFEQLFGMGADVFLDAARQAALVFAREAEMLHLGDLPKWSDASAHAPVAASAPASPDPGPPAATPDVLGIVTEIAAAILAHDAINDVLAMVLEGAARAGGFDRVLLALLTPAHDRLVGRLGWGEGVDDDLRGLNVPLRADAGVLAETVLARVPRLVEHGARPLAAGATFLGATSYLTHPVEVGGRAVGALVATRGGGPALVATDSATLRLFGTLAALSLDRAAARR